MYCKNCGSQMAENSKFCSNCGAIVTNDNLNSQNRNYSYGQNNMNNGYINQSNMINEQGNLNNSYTNQSNMSYGQTNLNNNYSNQNSYENNSDKKEVLGVVSLILGIISLLLAFFLNILILPVSITGLILGIVNKRRNGKKIAGIILNSIATAIIVIMVIIAFFVFGLDLFDNNTNSYVVGYYDCKGVNSSTDDYLVSLYLNKDNTFTYGPYGKLENNRATGTFTAISEEKTNGSGDTKYFKITMTGKKEDFIVDGKPSDTEFNSIVDFGVTTKNGKKQATIIFENSYNMYYCYER